ncbi:MAG: glutamate--tRNA ligase [Hyphomonadaceae bacterium]|nr:glutamate--tRNA ligase [Hyphomonadaceae bacterium]
MKPVVRFAPSSTGRLHVGNVRTALINWLFVRAFEDGKFVLRIDDTDTVRSTRAFEDGIREDLTWLGLTWDSTFNQSDRFDLYDAAAVRLKKTGRLYPCYETAEELDRQRKLQRMQNKPPTYNRAALNLTQEQKEAYRREGRLPHWRFRLSGRIVTWTDCVRGEQSVNTGSLSDPVLVRGDGSYLYTLPSVVDDIEAGITHVVRGEDHVANSGAQIEIFRALSDHLPNFAHVPLLVGKDGAVLSKRLGSLSIHQLREDGMEALAVCSLLARIGTSDPVDAQLSTDALVKEFAFSKIGRAPARFDEDELVLVNARLLHRTPYSVVKDRLDTLGVSGGEGFWNLIRANIERLPDTATWSTAIFAPMAGQIDDADREFCRAAAECLPATIGDDTWSSWTAELRQTTGREGGRLFMPLRKALTGRRRGPEMAAVLSLLGPERAKGRLHGEAA